MQMSYIRYSDHNRQIFKIICHTVFKNNFDLFIIYIYMVFILLLRYNGCIFKLFDNVRCIAGKNSHFPTSYTKRADHFSRISASDDDDGQADQARCGTTVGGSGRFASRILDGQRPLAALRDTGNEHVSAEICVPVIFH